VVENRSRELHRRRQPGSWPREWPGQGPKAVPARCHRLHVDFIDVIKESRKRGRDPLASFDVFKSACQDSSTGWRLAIKRVEVLYEDKTRPALPRAVAASRRAMSPALIVSYHDEWRFWRGDSGRQCWRRSSAMASRARVPVFPDCKSARASLTALTPAARSSSLSFSTCRRARTSSTVGTSAVRTLLLDNALKA
jgi:hypothetical protein